MISSMTNKPADSKPLSSSSLPERVSNKPDVTDADVDDRSRLEPDPEPVVGPNDEVPNPWPSSHPSPGHDLGLLENGQTNEIPPRGYSGGSSVTGIDTRSDEERRVNRTGETSEEIEAGLKRAEEATKEAEAKAKERDEAKARERDEAAKAANKK
jgi:hypothetical protein